MKCIGVFFLFLFSWWPLTVSMQEPGYPTKNIFTLQDVKVAGFAFFTPQLFAMATIQADFSSQITVGDASAKKILKSVITCPAQITSLTLCDNFRKIAVGLQNKILICYVETGQKIREYKAHMARVNSISACPDKEQVLISGSEDKTIAIWDLKSPIGSKIENAHDEGVKIVRIARNENNFLSCSDDKTTKLWDLNQLKQLHVINQFVKPASLAMEYNAQGDRFMICANYVSRYNAANTALMATFNRRGTQESLQGSKIKVTHSLIYSCDSTDKDEQELMAIGTENGTITLFYPEASTIQPRLINAFDSPVNQVTFSPQGTYLAACCQIDRLLHIYELPKRQPSPSQRKAGFKGCLGLE